MRSIAALLLLSSAALPQDLPSQTYGQPVPPRVVVYVQQALKNGDLASAEAMAQQYRRLNGDTPEALEALAWLARGEIAYGKPDEAFQTAEDVRQSAEKLLGLRGMDSEPHLPLALGAAYEVEAECLFSRGKRPEALLLLKKAQAKWKDTSLADRLQKNINLMTLQGRPMPLVRIPEWIGTKPSPAASWKGKPVLLFFWAHWCADCKAEAPILAKLAAEMEPRGLVVVGPTRRYGYTAQEEHAAPATETPFISRVFDKYYSGIPKMQVPLDASNFQRFGVSTTPTLVLVDRAGIVKMYHPGVLDEASLRTAIEGVLK